MESPSRISFPAYDFVQRIDHSVLHPGSEELPSHQLNHRPGKHAAVSIQNFQIPIRNRVSILRSRQRCTLQIESRPILGRHFPALYVGDRIRSILVNKCAMPRAHPDRIFDRASFFRSHAWIVAGSTGRSRAYMGSYTIPDALFRRIMGRARR